MGGGGQGGGKGVGVTKVKVKTHQGQGQGHTKVKFKAMPRYFAYYARCVFSVVKMSHQSEILHSLIF